MERAGAIMLIAVQGLGILISAALLAVTFADRAEVERQLQAFAIAQVEEAALEAWDAAGTQFEAGGRAERIGALASRFGLKADEVMAERDRIVPALMTHALSDRCGENCGLAAVSAFALDNALVERAAQLRLGQQTAEEFIVARYEASIAGLIADLRRFALVNLIVLTLMAALVIWRDVLNWRFAAFSTLMTGYVAYAAHGYVFGQNWALTILFQDWTGPVYQGTMIFIACLLADWLFLRGIITRTVVNGLASMVPG